MEFSRQEYWNRLLFHLPRDLPNPGIEPRSPAWQEDSLPTESPGKTPDGARGKEPTCQCMRTKRCRFDPWVGKITWRQACNPLKYSFLGNPLDRGAWWAAVHGGLGKSRIYMVFPWCWERTKHPLMSGNWSDLTSRSQCYPSWWSFTPKSCNSVEHKQYHRISVSNEVTLRPWKSKTKMGSLWNL